MKIKKWYTIWGIFILCILIVVVILWWLSTTTIYIVRHAEKDTAPPNDPLLTDDGWQRAVTLADLLKDNDFATIYSTNTLRTKSTAQPLSDSVGVPVQSYTAGNNPLSSTSLPLWGRKTILIEGHSKTILDLFADLGCTSSLTIIVDSDFDNLLIVEKRRLFFETVTACNETTYGVLTPP